MYLNPDRMVLEERLATVAWLERNGCRHHIALEPIVIAGQWAHYTALCRKDDKSLARMRVHNGEFVPLGRRRVRLRSPR